MAIGLLLIDIQYDFIDGSLAVEDATSILPTAHGLVDEYPFDLIVVSQDWHPQDHVSFAASHPGKQPFTSIDHVHPLQPDQPIKQELWPTHCVQRTRGAAIEHGLAARLEALAPGSLAAAEQDIPSTPDAKSREGASTRRDVVLVQKGTQRDADGYSAFTLNGYLGFTDLPRTLLAWPSLSSAPSQDPAETRKRSGDKIDTLIVCGLATDYCIARTAIDARKFGFRTIVVEDGVRGVAHDSICRAWEQMERFGCERVKTAKEAWALASSKGRASAPST